MVGRSLLFLVLLFRIYTGSAQDNHKCVSSFCGNNIISHPFRLNTDPDICGYSKYELSCENNRTVLYLDEGKYYVQSINYDNFTIRITGAGLQESNCSSMPYSSFKCSTYSYYHFHRAYSCTRSYENTNGYTVSDILSRTVAYVECANEIESPLYTKITPCIKSRNSSSDFFNIYRHPYIVDAHNASCVEASCIIRLVSRTSWPRSGWHHGLSYADFHDGLVYGFELSWLSSLCEGCYKKHQACGQIIREKQGYKLKCENGFRLLVDIWYVGPALIMNYASPPWFLLTRGVGLLCVPIFLTYKWRRRHRAADENIEEFLQNQNKLFPIRYSYSNIKKITRNFKDRLGEGGYGFVYKGKLRSGQDVAIKILKCTKSNGEDFINEVATIGRIHHVNVVQLVGFCVEGSKRALVYDFMPNGSLDKHIFYRENGTSFGCKEIYEISLGVARGIEYLHRGCDMQILHFDIKPHNILLDENFIPKISDFGLAKLYPTNHNTISLTAVRGTLGYMAPELVYKMIGGVSHKVDVYSFGKLLMEMACRRKNVDATVECSSQIYFPSWVYDQLTKGNKIEIVDVVEEEESEIMKKMMIVALWCIQMNPDDRPPMHEVLKMLEGFGNPLLPHKPLLYQPGVSVQISNTNINFEMQESSFMGSSLSPTNFSEKINDVIEEVSLMQYGQC